MTDFLDQLEDELRVAAERRGQPRRRRPPTSALKAVAAIAVIALVVVGVARLANGGTDAEQAAAPSPTPTPEPAQGTTVRYATAGDPALLNLLSARVRGFIWTEIPEGENTADPDLGSVVLYRPQGEEIARYLAYTAKIEEVRPLTEADQRGIHTDLSGADVVVLYGPGADERLLADPEICAPSGGALKLCVDRSDERRYSVFVLGDEPLTVEPLDDRGWWSWAALSPDGKTILAQWEGDCPRAALIPAGGGEPRELGRGEALGWTTDDRAIVSGCGADGHYLYSLDGSRERWAGPKGRMEPSLRPIDLGG